MQKTSCKLLNELIKKNTETITKIFNKTQKMALYTIHVQIVKVFQKNKCSVKYVNAVVLKKARIVKRLQQRVLVKNLRTAV